MERLLRAQDVQYPLTWQGTDTQSMNSVCVDVALDSSEVQHLIEEAESTGGKVLKVMQ